MVRDGIFRFHIENTDKFHKNKKKVIIIYFKKLNRNIDRVIGIFLNIPVWWHKMLCRTCEAAITGAKYHKFVYKRFLLDLKDNAFRFLNLFYKKSILGISGICLIL